MVLYDIYEHETGVFRHYPRDKTRPLSSVALHETEDNTLSSRLYFMIDAYRKKGIKDLFGLNLVEFLELPNELTIYLMELATREEGKTKAELDALAALANKS